MSGPPQLFGAVEISETLGVSREWVRKHARQGKGPKPDFQALAGAKRMLLWTQQSVDRWRAYHASVESMPVMDRYTSYSDHNATNQVGSLTITWKLWWRNTHDGGAIWWFSTPRGWYVSNDDGQTWDFADVMVRPGDYHYYCVSGNVMPKRSVATILRSTQKLRQHLEGGK